MVGLVLSHDVVPPSIPKKRAPVRSPRHLGAIRLRVGALCTLLTKLGAIGGGGFAGGHGGGFVRQKPARQYKVGGAFLREKTDHGILGEGPRWSIVLTFRILPPQFLKIRPLRVNPPRRHQHEAAG